MTTESSNNPAIEYGVADGTFRAAGKQSGIRKLVDAFYDIMESNPAYQTIWDWHPNNQELTRDKLSCFLCGWMGGPRRYQEKFGAINIPAVHAHLKVSQDERNQWLSCMAEALAQQAYPESLVVYLLEQLAVPATAIQRRCES